MNSLPKETLKNLSEETRALASRWPWEEGWVVLNYPIEFMRFTLIYDGPLKSASGSDNRQDNKHEIRKALHPQLAEVWQGHHSLQREYANALRFPEYDRTLREGQLDSAWETVKGRCREDCDSFLFPMDVGGFCFLPLVTKKLWLTCDLDILFLRNEPLGHIINSGGDIDNRLKVLFDALRAPETAKELPSSATPGDKESPLFCLLEDDSLITAVRVESERLLDSSSMQKERVRLVIRVTVKVQRLRAITLDLI